MAPTITIALFALVGFFLNGIAGGIIGAAIGFAFTFALGLIVNRLRGGLLPRRARRDLIVSLLARHSDVVAVALPGVQGESLFRALDALLERIAQRAASLAPSPSVVFTAGVMSAALGAMLDEESREGTRALYRSIALEMGARWYGAGSQVRDRSDG